jgi:hypothetical protein
MHELDRGQNALLRAQRRQKTLTITAAYDATGAGIWDNFDNLNVQPLVSVSGKPTLVSQTITDEASRPHLATGDKFYFFWRASGSTPITDYPLVTTALIPTSSLTAGDTGYMVPISETRFMYTPSYQSDGVTAYSPTRWLVEFTIGDLSEVPASVTGQLKGSITLGDGDTHSCTHTLSTSAGNALYVTGTGTIGENEIGSVSLGNLRPVGAQTPAGASDVTMPDSADYTVQSVSWAPDDASFSAGTAYTATIVLNAAGGKTFSGICAVVADGMTVSERTRSNENATLTVTAAYTTGAQKSITGTLTAPQTYGGASTPVDDEIGYDSSVVSASSSAFPYGTTVYFPVQDSGVTVADPDFIDPSEYTVTIDGGSGNDTVASVGLVRGKHSTGYRWWLAVTFIDDPGTGASIAAGTVTIARSGAADVTLSLDDRNIMLGTTTALVFTRMSNWAQLKNEDGTISSISGADEAESILIEQGVNEVYYALYRGNSTVVNTTLDLSDYAVDYTPKADSIYTNYVTGGEIVRETWKSTSTGATTENRLFVKLNLDPARTELSNADGIITVTRMSDSLVIFSFDLASNTEIHLDGEDTVSLDGKFDNRQRLSRVDPTLLIEYQNMIGKPSELGVATNVAYGETAYFAIYGRNSLGDDVPITEAPYVQSVDIEAPTQYNSNFDKIDRMEIVKKQSTNGDYRYYLAIRTVPLNYTSRYTVFVDLTLKKSGSYGVNNSENGNSSKINVDIEFVVGSERAAVGTNLGNRYDFNGRCLSDTVLRYDFGYTELAGDQMSESYTYVVGGDEADVIYLYGSEERNYFTVNTMNQRQILLGNDILYVDSVGEAFPDALLDFVNGNGKSFNKFGILTLCAPPGSFIYERSGNTLYPPNQDSYDELEEAFKIRTKTLGCYVISNVELDISRIAIGRIAEWAQAENEDGTISTISGAGSNSPTVEYGSTCYYAMRNSLDKDILAEGALDPSRFVCTFTPSEGSINGVMDCYLAYRTQYKTSDESRTDKYYLAVQFGEVADPGVLRNISGVISITIDGEEVASFNMIANRSVNLHGGRAVDIAEAIAPPEDEDLWDELTGESDGDDDAPADDTAAAPAQDAQTAPAAASGSSEDEDENE